MKTLYFEYFSTYQDASDFINKNEIRKEDILTLTANKDGAFLYYYK